jgi:hypothetical protein
VVAGLGAGRAFHAVSRLAVALADASRLLAAEAEARDLDLGEGNGDDVFALAADELALGQVLAEFLLDHATDDLAEALHVAIDLAQHHRHRTCRQRPPSRWVAAARVRDFPRRDKIAPAGRERAVLQCAPTGGA